MIKCKFLFSVPMEWILRYIKTYIFVSFQLESFARCKLNTSLVSGCRELLSTRRSVRRLMERCEKISSEMTDVISELTNHTQADDGEQENSSYLMKQPSLLNSRSVSSSTIKFKKST